MCVSTQNAHSFKYTHYQVTEDIDEITQINNTTSLEPIIK